MSLPKQVQQQLDEVAAIEAAMQVQNTPAEPAPETPAETPPAVVPPEVKTPEPVVTPPVTEPKQEEPWQQRYQTLKGMFDSQVPVLHRQNKELQQSIQQLQEEIAKLKAPKQETQPASLVTDKDEEEFGKDLIELQRKVVREMVTPLQGRIAELEAEKAALSAKLGQTDTRIAEMTFEQRLAAKVPDFDTVNRDPRWIAWLDEHDPILRGPRRNAAQAAFASGDAEAVADYVSLWKGSIKAPTPPKADSLEGQVAPSRSAAAVAPQASQEKLYTEAEANAAWDKISQLNRQGKYEEAGKLEAELTAAYSTGRVR